MCSGRAQVIKIRGFPQGAARRKSDQLLASAVTSHCRISVHNQELQPLFERSQP